jgi:hypothetical protein
MIDNPRTLEFENSSLVKNVGHRLLTNLNPETVSRVNKATQAYAEWVGPLTATFVNMMLTEDKPTYSSEFPQDINDSVYVLSQTYEKKAGRDISFILNRVRSRQEFIEKEFDEQRKIGPSQGFSDAHDPKLLELARIGIFLGNVEKEIMFRFPKEYKELVTD